MSETRRRVILVGGTKGLGRIFKLICENETDWRIFNFARNPVNASDIRCDVTNQEDIVSALKKVNMDSEGIDSIVFFQRYRGTEDSWHNEMEVCVKGVDLFINSAVEYFKLSACPDKSVVIVSSISSLFVTSEQNAAYHASRAAQIGLMRYHAHRQGKYGIRVNAVSFGSIVKGSNIEYYDAHPKIKKKLADCSPLGRMGASDEVARAIKFLISQESSWISGQNLIVDGGSSVEWAESNSR